MCKCECVSVTYSSLRKSKALLLSLGSCCRALLFFLMEGWIWAVGALYLTLTGASPAGFLAAPPDELNRRLKLGRRGARDGAEREEDGEKREHTETLIEGWTQAAGGFRGQGSGTGVGGRVTATQTHTHTRPLPSPLTHPYNLPLTHTHTHHPVPTYPEL